MWHNGEEEKCIQGFLGGEGKPEEKDYCEKLDIDRSTILKYMLNEIGWENADCINMAHERQNIRRKMKRRMEKQHLVLWRGPCSTQRQAQELISGPDLATRARLLSF
jgi:hypothetical protein